MIEQYLSIKEQYQDAILFYRMGDFYEMFFEDAELASGILEITLTSRNKNDKNPIPMCGVPYHAAKTYIARLIAQGHKIAICDQIEDAALAKGLVKRDVVRVVTPGMVIEDDLLEATANNFILAFYFDRERAGLAGLDISTGEFRVCESKRPLALVDEAIRMAPRELLLPEIAREDDRFREIKEAFVEQSITYLEDMVFEYPRSRERLLSLFQTLSLEGYGCEDLTVGVSAAGAIVAYVGDTQKQAVAHIRDIKPYLLSAYLQVDETSARNLELMKNIRSGSRRGTLISVLDKTITAMGGRLFKQWLNYPLIDPKPLAMRLDAVDEAKKRIAVTGDIRAVLKTVADLERITGRLNMGHGNARDLIALKRSLQSLPDIFERLESFEAPLYQMEDDLTPLHALSQELERAVREDAPLTLHEGGLIQPGYHDRLDELIHLSRDGKGWLARLENQERKATGIPNLKVKFNKVFGYFLEVTKSHVGAVPDHYVRRQTLVNAERYITDELKRFEENVLGAEERRAKLEYELFCGLKEKVVEKNDLIFKAAHFVARLDCLLNLAMVADQNDYHRPRFNAKGIIDIKNGRHPVVEKVLSGERFVPNDIRLDNERAQVLVVTGPNMAGKSTILRQTALTVIMAQMGSFVPAESASIGITDRIFTRVGALDNLASGQSTFLVEMQETANILNNANLQSLVIMDEIGRGTSTFDGLSIAWAVAAYLHDLKQTGVKTLFATHYHELCELAEIKPRVKNYSIAVKEWNDEIIFLRKLVKGGTNRSYGIQVARLAGIPLEVVTQAKAKLAEIEHRTAAGMHRPVRASTGGQISEHVQLGLFTTPAEEVIDELGRIDINQISPLKAMNMLDELIRKLNNHVKT